MSRRLKGALSFLSESERIAPLLRRAEGGPTLLLLTSMGLTSERPTSEGPTSKELTSFDADSKGPTPSHQSYGCSVRLG